MTEVEFLKGKLADTQKAIEREEHKEQFKEVATFFHDMFQSFLDAGFNEEQAWFLTGTAFQTKLK
jgi:hypothetical protein